MTKGELKKIIRETVKDCIKEVLLENEIFSSIIKEVIISTKNTVLESNNRITVQPASSKKNIYQEAGSSLRNRNDFQKSSYEDIGETLERDTARFGEKTLVNEADDFSTAKSVSNGSDAVQYMNDLAEQANTVPIDTLKALFGMN